eukprot:9427266-Pyramimonas_sp.AAC.1
MHEKPRWIIQEAKKPGWAVACSTPPPRAGIHSVAHGSAAIFWSPRLGRASVVRDKLFGRR